MQLAQVLLVALAKEEDGRALIAFTGFREVDGIVEGPDRGDLVAQCA